MTPFELSLRHELEIERQRFDSEWLFQWYNIRSERRIVDVPDYRGGRITMGGLRFDSQPQSIFWQALGRYLNGKVHDIFQRWDRETGAYPSELRRSSLDGTENLLRQFVAALMTRAHSTDQALRGEGTPKTDKALEGSSAHSHANVEIVRLKQAHEALLPVISEPTKGMTFGLRLIEALNIKPGMFGMNIDLKKLFWREKR
jgi:hypothetical protein